MKAIISSLLLASTTSAIILIHKSADAGVIWDSSNNEELLNAGLGDGGRKINASEIPMDELTDDQINGVKLEAGVAPEEGDRIAKFLAARNGADPQWLAEQATAK